MKYTVCSKCGANLDPGEKCDCKPMKQTVTDILHEVIQKMCDEYCKYPEQYTGEDEDKLYEEKCDNCPLNLL